MYLDPDLDLEIALKLRPYGGLIGINNSSLDVYFKIFKVLRLQAILHDACGFVHEYSEKGPVIHTFYAVQSQMNMWVM